MQLINGRLTPFQINVGQTLKTIASPRYYWITRPLMVFLITRLIVFFGAYLAEIAIPGITQEGFYHVNPNNVWFDVWARWDSAFYIRVVEHGYWFTIGQQSSVAFFPLYPLLVNMTAIFVGNTLVAAVLVSNFCFLVALMFLYQLTELEFGDSATASRTIFYIAVFPTAFFFTAVYTESTFLLFTVATMYFARRRLWVWAALFGLLCSASRIVGVVVWGAVMLEWMNVHGWTLGKIYTLRAWQNLFRGIRSDWFNMLVLCLMPLGLISYMVFLKIQFNDPVAFNTTQAAWGRQMIGPWAVIYRDLAGLIGGNFFTGDIWYHVILDLGAFAAVLAISVAIWRRLGASYALYCIISILIPASSGTGSLSRYALVIFPMFMLLGHWGRRHWLDRALVIMFSVMLGILTAMFVNWVFVA